MTQENAPDVVVEMKSATVVVFIVGPKKTVLQLILVKLSSVLMFLKNLVVTV